MVYDLAGQNLIAGLNPYSAYAKANQQANLANELAILEAQQRAQQLAQSGQQSTPAALQLANEYQAALQSGDIARANQIAAFAKVYDKGIAVTPEGQFSPAQGYASALGQLEKGAQSGKEQAKLQTQAQFDLPGAEMQAGLTSGTIDQLLVHPGLPAIFGIPGQFPNIPAGEAAAAQAMYDQVLGQAFLEGRRLLKGGGAITDFESQKAENAFIRASRAQSVEEFTKAAREFQNYVNAGTQKLRKQASGQVFQDYGDGLGEIVLTPDPQFEATPTLAEQSKANFKGRNSASRVVNFEDLP